MRGYGNVKKIWDESCEKTARIFGGEVEGRVVFLREPEY